MSDHAEGDEPTLTDRVWLDTEFIEDGRTIELLSIGLVREDGATYYAEPVETDRSRADDWVTRNVIPSLTGPVKPRAQIAAEIVAFVGPRPEFWAWYADYDWVVLCQMYGRMIDLPDGWPMFCHDYKQIAPPDTKQVDGNHNALADAEWLRTAMLLADRARPAPAATHVVHATAQPLAEDVVWCEECEEWVMSGDPAATPTDTAAQAVRDAAEQVRSSVRYGAGMNPDGTEDPQMAAYVEGIGDAYRIVTDAADRLAAQPRVTGQRTERGDDR